MSFLRERHPTLDPRRPSLMISCSDWKVDYISELKQHKQTTASVSIHWLSYNTCKYNWSLNSNISMPLLPHAYTIQYRLKCNAPSLKSLSLFILWKSVHDVPTPTGHEVLGGFDPATWSVHSRSGCESLFMMYQHRRVTKYSGASTPLLEVYRFDQDAS